MQSQRGRDCLAKMTRPKTCTTVRAIVLNAKKVADVFGLNLRQLSGLLETLPATVHKTPDSERLQGKLRLFERIAKGLSLVDNDEDSFRRWLNAPNPELEQKTPLEIVREGRGEVVANLVEDALLGQPS